MSGSLSSRKELVLALGKHRRGFCSAMFLVPDGETTLPRHLTLQRSERGVFRIDGEGERDRLSLRLEVVKQTGFRLECRVELLQRLPSRSEEDKCHESRSASVSRVANRSGAGNPR